jgi:DNA-binding transcriptional ArsR family regulator
VSDEEHGTPGGAPEERAARRVTDVETLKVLAEPTRLAILGALMGRSRERLRVMSVKELAAELGEPQTKLYRHVKQLEAAGLIRVAASRLVSGILEQRYQACQGDLIFGPELLSGTAADESEPFVAAVLDRYRSQYFAAERAGLLAAADGAPAESYRQGILAMVELRVSPDRAAAVRARLQEVLDELDAPGADDPDGVPVNVLVGFHTGGSGGA